jgi:hypothetical protein
VLALDTDYERVLPRSSPVAPPALDQRGTRRAPRVVMADDVPVLVDGKSAKVIDLSTVGAQVVSTAILKPNQSVRVTLRDDQASMQLNAAIAWASFEISPRGSPQYRAGISFVNGDNAAIDSFCARHRKS